MDNKEPQDDIIIPGTLKKPMSLRKARKWCRKLALSHYENFSVVSLLLPRRYRNAFYVIYAWCRFSDDLGDESGDPEEALLRLNRWENKLNALYDALRSHEKNPDVLDHPILIALYDVVDQYCLPKQPFLDLIRAFKQDQVKSSYNTREELLEYCRCSANPVGRLLLYITVGQPTAQQLEWSDKICTGLQLINFWQDVKRDKELGRFYIPEDIVWQCKTYRSIIRYLTDWTEEFFMEGRPLLKTLPFRIRYEIGLFWGGGMTILRKIRDIHYQTDEFRPTLSVWNKLGLLLRFFPS